jgi:hypothetical protein
LLDGLLVCGSKTAAAQETRGEKMQFLQSFQADRCVTDWFMLTERRGAMSLRPPQSSLSELGS